jgi:hypothetical protein
MTKKKSLPLIAILPLSIAVTLGILAMLPLRPGVTKANFDRIEKGMTLAEVEEIFGTKGEMPITISGRRTVYEWKASDGSWAILVFGNDRLLGSGWDNSNEMDRWLQQTANILEFGEYPVGPKKAEDKTREQGKKGNAIMDHEVDDSAFVHGTKFLSSHPKELFVVGQESSDDTEEQHRKAECKDSGNDRPCERRMYLPVDSELQRACHGLEGIGCHRQPRNDEARLAWLDIRFGKYEASVGRVQVPKETYRDRRVLRPAQSGRGSSRHALARDRPRHRRSRRSPRPGLERDCHSVGGHPSCLRQFAPDGHEARRLAGDVCGLQEDFSPLQASEEVERLPMQVCGPLAADFRVHGRSSAQARCADDRRKVCKLASKMCGMRNSASPITQAESGGVALQMRSPMRTHLAVPVAKMTAEGGTMKIVPEEP